MTILQRNTTMVDSPSAYQSSANLCLYVSVTPHPTGFPSSSSFTELHLSSLSYHAVLEDREYRQYRVWFDLLCGARHCSWHSSTWAGLWLGQMVSALAFWKLRCRRASGCLQALLDFTSLLPEFEF